MREHHAAEMRTPEFCHGGLSGPNISPTITQAARYQQFFWRNRADVSINSVGNCRGAHPEKRTAGKENRAHPAHTPEIYSLHNCTAPHAYILTPSSTPQSLHLHLQNPAPFTPDLRIPIPRRQPTGLRRPSSLHSKRTPHNLVAPRAPRPQKMPAKSRFTRLDAFTKTVEDARVRTTSGGIVTIVSLLVMVWLVWGEWADYRRIGVKAELVVDRGRGGFVFF